MAPWEQQAEMNRLHRADVHIAGRIHRPGQRQIQNPCQRALPASVVAGGHGSPALAAGVAAAVMVHGAAAHGFGKALIHLLNDQRLVQVMHLLIAGAVFVVHIRVNLVHQLAGVDFESVYALPDKGNQMIEPRGRIAGLLPADDALLFSRQIMIYAEP